MKNNKTKSLEVIPVQGIPSIKPGDDLSKKIASAIHNQEDSLRENDILVITQKIVSKAENRLIHSSQIKVTEKAKKISSTTSKKPELVELILQESNKILRYNKRTIIVEHKLGFVCANAGIDQSNVESTKEIKQGEWYLLLPENPDKSAEKIRKFLEKKFSVNLGVMIIDSHGRAWRYGTVGTSIGLSGIPALVDLRGTPDLFGRELMITRVGVADELAGAASLMMGQAAEKIPAVIVRGFPYGFREATISELFRPEELDLFR